MIGTIGERGEQTRPIEMKERERERERESRVAAGAYKKWLDTVRLPLLSIIFAYIMIRQTCGQTA